MKRQKCNIEGGTFWGCSNLLSLSSFALPISHLMCGGCSDLHAKMNNNRLLVTTEHEHTHATRLSFRHFPSRLLSPRKKRSKSVFSEIYEQIYIPLFSSVSICLTLSTHQSETLTFRLKVTPHIPLFHIELMTCYQCSWWYRVSDSACACSNSFSSQSNMSSDSYLQILSIFAYWDKPVENGVGVDCSVYWNARHKVCRWTIKRNQKVWFVKEAKKKTIADIWQRIQQWVVQEVQMAQVNLKC